MIHSIRTSLHERTHQAAGSVQKALSGKIGQCPTCIRAAVAGTLLGWLAAGVAVSAHWASIALVAIAVAIVFTLVLVAHVWVFTARALHASLDESAHTQGRRRFLSTFAKVGVFAVAATLEGPLRALGVAASDPGNSLCTRLCRSLFPPGPERGRCISEGARGMGLCHQGSCLPEPSEDSGFKTKQSWDERIQTLLDNRVTSSSLAGNFFQTARRYLGGASPANALEDALFPRFTALSEPTLQVLGCAVRRFESLSMEDRTALYGDLFATLGENAITINDLSHAISLELGTILDNDPQVPRLCTIERAGEVRDLLFYGVEGDVLAPVPWISKVNGYRTLSFIKEGGGYLTKGEYEAWEFEQDCTTDASGNPFCLPEEIPCSVPGYQIEGVCLHLETVIPGRTANLEGLNFYDVDAIVRLRLLNSSIFRDIPARVCGDLNSPGLKDSRVKDVIGFKIPLDMPDGLYEISVVATDPISGMTYETPPYYRPYLRVLEPFSGHFQVHTKSLTCNEETGWDIPYTSDEVAIDVGVFPVLASQRSPSIAHATGRFPDMDSGETRDMTLTLLDVANNSNLLGIVVLIKGYEVDSEEAFKEMNDDLWELYKQYLKEELDLLQDLLERLSSLFENEEIAEFIKAHPIVAGIAAGVALATPLFIALWAPADIIIDDAIALAPEELLEMTAYNFPPPHIPPYSGPLTTASGIEVEVTDIQKEPGLFRETRQYKSDNEGSRYSIVMEYVRVQPALARGRSLVAGGAAANPPSGGPRLIVSQRPSRAPLQFSWQGATATEIRIFDVAGRLQARVDISRHGRSGNILWDGKNERGQQLPAGVYFAVLSGREGEARTRIVLMAK